MPQFLSSILISLGFQFLKRSEVDYDERLFGFDSHPAPSALDDLDRTRTWAVGPGFYIPRLWRFASLPLEIYGFRFVLAPSLISDPADSLGACPFLSNSHSRFAINHLSFLCCNHQP